VGRKDEKEKIAKFRGSIDVIGRKDFREGEKRVKRKGSKIS